MKKKNNDYIKDNDYYNDDLKKIIDNNSKTIKFNEFTLYKLDKQHFIKLNK